MLRLLDQNTYLFIFWSKLILYFTSGLLCIDFSKSSKNFTINHLGTSPRKLSHLLDPPPRLWLAYSNFRIHHLSDRCQISQSEAEEAGLWRLLRDRCLGATSFPCLLVWIWTVGLDRTRTGRIQWSGLQDGHGNVSIGKVPNRFFRHWWKLYRAAVSIGC